MFLSLKKHYGLLIKFPGEYRYEEFQAIWIHDHELNTCELTQFEVGNPMKIEIKGLSKENLINGVRRVEVKLDDKNITDVQLPLL